MALFSRLAVIGVGLIGGSLARAVRANGLAGEIVGSGRDSSQLARAVELGVIDRFTERPADAVAGADLVVVAVPVGAMERVFSDIAPALSPEAVLTDVGSVKGCVVQAAESVFQTLPAGFVPAHPIAGTEKSGVEASFAELFKDRCTIITPLSGSRTEAVDKVRQLWLGVGSQVVTMGVRHHDEVLAATSHLPHMLAFALVDTLARMEESREIFRFAAGGFRDFTRIASSDPVMWRDICLTNKDALLAMMDRFQDDLASLGEAIRMADADGIKAVFERAKAARDAFTEQYDRQRERQ